MVLLTVLLVTLAVIAVGVALALIVGGAALLPVLLDVAFCAGVIVLIVKLFKKKSKK